MKRLLCIFICLLMFFGTAVNTYAEETSESANEVRTELPIIDSLTPDIRPQLKPEYIDVNNISLTFYIVNGKAFVSYSAAAKTSGITVNVKLEKQKYGFLWVDAAEEKSDYSNKKYISGSYSAAVKDSGTYRVLIEVKVKNETIEKESVYEYDKTKVHGDAVADGVIRANDARLILRFSARLEKYTEKQKTMCDIDNSGSITAADARIALRIAAKLI